MFGHVGGCSIARAGDGTEETTIVGSTVASARGVAEEPTRQRQSGCTSARNPCSMWKANGFRVRERLREWVLVLEIVSCIPESILEFWWQMVLPITVEDVKREVKILKELIGHENVVKFFNAFEHDSYVYIVME
ncbi:hypothetical protein JHK82_039359 [Glycine max]|nr:hypothetical protein JHK82_039359 [Glycine max]KAG5121423.1 hypothetical protein JHK84_039763 [Glycine max]